MSVSYLLSFKLNNPLNFLTSSADRRVVAHTDYAVSRQFVFETRSIHLSTVSLPSDHHERLQNQPPPFLFISVTIFAQRVHRRPHSSIFLLARLSLISKKTRNAMPVLNTPRYAKVSQNKTKSQSQNRLLKRTWSIFHSFFVSVHS